ncbi:sugar phosphate isomerase/epimerase family protein [Rhizobium ruizarguesonis]|uniref:sugar phosphate isomerase/epimerase family protein n=1 Tax=Rhizobium ruizarguesonis TaxID=2081791 RepID=UPI0010311D6D|nr:sugar phosphate isomerase/epimerase family protein [Rhizobium ruizarguesonis]TBA11992.1 sugar phosphate isomerase/epimerase [Rhizobium ruizarguesonis]
MMMNIGRAGLSYSGLADEASSDIFEQISAHKALGWSSIELRSCGGRQIVSFSDEERRRLCEAIMASDLMVSCISSPIGNWSRTLDYPLEDELLELKRLSAISEQLGTKFVRIMSYANTETNADDAQARSVERIRKLVAFAEDSGLILLHENCTGWAGQSSDLTNRLLDEVPSEALGLLFDIGNGLAYGYDSLTFLRGVVPAVRHVHVKDGRRLPGATDSASNVSYGLAGTGDAFVLKCIALLVESGYCGHFSIEPHISLIPHLQDPKHGSPNWESYVRYAQHFESLTSLIYEQRS